MLKKKIFYIVPSEIEGILFKNNGKKERVLSTKDLKKGRQSLAYQSEVSSFEDYEKDLEKGVKKYPTSFLDKRVAISTVPTNASPVILRDHFNCLEYCDFKETFLTEECNALLAFLSKQFSLRKTTVILDVGTSVISIAIFNQRESTFKKALKIEHSIFDLIKSKKEFAMEIMEEVFELIHEQSIDFKEVTLYYLSENPNLADFIKSYYEEKIQLKELKWKDRQEFLLQGLEIMYEQDLENFIPRK